MALRLEYPYKKDSLLWDGKEHIIEPDELNSFKIDDNTFYLLDYYDRTSFQYALAILDKYDDQIISIPVENKDKLFDLLRTGQIKLKEENLSLFDEVKLITADKPYKDMDEFINAMKKPIQGEQFFKTPEPFEQNHFKVPEPFPKTEQFFKTPDSFKETEKVKQVPTYYVAIQCAEDEQIFRGKFNQNSLFLGLKLFELKDGKFTAVDNNVPEVYEYLSKETNSLTQGQFKSIENIQPLFTDKANYNFVGSYGLFANFLDEVTPIEQDKDDTSTLSSILLGYKPSYGYTKKGIWLEGQIDHLINIKEIKDKKEPKRRM